MSKANLLKAQRADTPPQTAPLNKWLIFAIVAMALLMMTIDATIVATALHTLQIDLNTSVSWVGWTLTAYSFGFILMLPLSAKLSTRYGHRRIFILSVATFTVASLFCGLTNNIFTLIALRVFQALGGAGITPSATGIIVEHFQQSRDRFLGLFGSIFSIGALIGPIFGGLFVTYWNWRGIFFINLPIGMAVIVLALRYIPTDVLKNAPREKMDLPGLLYLAIAILSGMYAGTYLSQEGTSVLSSIFVGSALLSVFGFIALFRHLKRVKQPFIQPRLIFGKGFGAVNLVNIIQSGMSIGAISLVPFYAVHRYGISELNSGTLLVGNGIASVVLSAIMSFYLRRTGYRLPLYIGDLLLVAGITLLAISPHFGIAPFVWLMISTSLIGLGFGVMGPAGRNAGLQLAPDQSANIAAVRSLGIQIGQIVMIATATAIIAGSKDPNYAQAIVYVGLAIILVLTMPVFSRVPENKGSW